MPAIPRSHFERVREYVSIELAPGDRALDAGCGPGLDAIAIAEWSGAKVVGMDVSDSVFDSPARGIAGVSLVQASVLAPPFAERTFTLVYSYGVLHHTAAPARAFSALGRLVAPAGLCVIYVYSDLREEGLVRGAVAVVSLLRRLTVRLPHRALFALCRLGAPVVYVTFGITSMWLRSVGRRDLAEKLPFNWVRGPFTAVGDLYDRMSAPIEHRHSRDEIAAWYASSGLCDVRIVHMRDARGWVAAGRRPA